MHCCVRYRLCGTNRNTNPSSLLGCSAFYTLLFFLSDINMPTYSQLAISDANVTFYFNDFTYEFALKPERLCNGRNTRWSTVYMRSDALSQVCIFCERCKHHETIS